MNSLLEGALQASRGDQWNPGQLATGRRLNRAGALFTPETATPAATPTGRREKQV
jgi:hypothetical protein